MKKILLLFTGGTIGSILLDGTFTTSGEAAYELLYRFEQHYSHSDAVQFDTLNPLAILSENLAPAAWPSIIQAIESAQPDQYDGIIVTHGTDTLPYTACALSMYFNTLDKPLLLVSSDYPLANPNANGLANFICAVEFIRQNIANGVFVPYRNAGETMQIHRGARLTCSPQLTGDFFSVRNKNFMQFENERFIPIAASPENTTKAIRLKPAFSSRILMIKPYPGLDYRQFNLDGVDAVLHDLYHSGTACATKQWGQQHSLVEFLLACNSKNIPVFIAPAFKSESVYQSARELLDNGAKLLANLSIEAAYVKLMLAYGNFDYDPIALLDFIDTDIAYEHITLQ